MNDVPGQTRKGCRDSDVSANVRRAWYVIVFCRQLALMARLNQLVKEDSQFIIATHSPILMAFPGATLLQITNEGIAPVAYEKTEHFQVTRRFLNNPQRMLNELLSDDV